MKPVLTFLLPEDRLCFFRGIGCCMAIVSWLAAAAVFAETGQQPFFVCADFHCDDGRMVQLPAGRWQSVRGLFRGETTPAGERERIRQAIALLETAVGSITGTWRDTGGNYSAAGDAGQLDCISESINTTTYLLLMSNDGLLQWHEVGIRQVRRPLIFDEHWTAVIVDRSDGRAYAVDSWLFDNGQPPVILPLSDWMKGRDTEVRDRNRINGAQTPG